MSKESPVVVHVGLGRRLLPKTYLSKGPPIYVDVMISVRRSRASVRYLIEATDHWTGKFLAARSISEAFTVELVETLRAIERSIGRPIGVVFIDHKIVGDIGEFRFARYWNQGAIHGKVGIPRLLVVQLP